MPYIITTAGKLADGTLHQWGDPVAVATLEEAREEAKNHADNLPIEDKAGPWYRAIDALPESGGSVGPLPDGTIIEVSRVAWGTIAELAPSDTLDPIAAFNAS